MRLQGYKKFIRSIDKAEKELEESFKKYKRDQELTSPYGDNNPPLPMSNPGDKDYSC